MSEEPKRIIVNTFEGGQVNDPDVSKRKNNSFSFGNNVRVFQDRNGLVITNIKGNKYSEEDKVGFRISEGFIPLAGCEIDNILYVISAKEEWINDDEDAHVGEIGCFPSWSSHDGNGTLDGDEDFDLDGFTNIQEIQCDSDPGDPNSKCTRMLPFLMLLLD